MLEEIISNSKDHTPLILHSKAVQKIAVMMCDNLGVKNEKIRNTISKASLLHDIGKCYSGFQTYVKSNKVSDKFTSSNLFHNEISWAFLSTIMNSNSTIYLDSLLYSIYWHHTKDMKTSKSKEYSGEIIEKLNEIDIQLMLKLYNELTGENIDKLNLDKNKNLKYPDYYTSNSSKIYSSDVQYNLIVLSCLVSADRLVSSNDQQKILNNDDYCIEIINKIDYSEIINFSKPESYDGDRFSEQMTCIDNLSNGTTIIKAAAGYGKTTLGLCAWMKTSNKKLLWVCPRNVICEALYDGIIKEIGLLNVDKKISVELFLSNEVKKSYNNDNIGDGFTSDIIITNIDNFLLPSTGNRYRNRMYLLLSSFIVFDEFHELISKEAFFYCFFNVMRCRHYYTNSKTLLLSATPSLISRLWDNDKNKTQILPNENTHYKAAHDKKYTIKLLTKVNDIIPEKNSLFITNAISSAQKTYLKHPYTLLVHSNFIQKDKDRIIQKIFHTYGKKSETNDKIGVISAPILQAAMDISFDKITEIVMSPECTFQRLGRNNRWGYNDSAEFNIITNITDNISIKKCEDSAINCMYDNNLKNKWVNFLIKNILPENEYNLNELYVLYNNFNEENKKDISNYISDQLKTSFTNLSKIYPRKIILNKKNKNGVTISKYANLRDNGTEKMFCIYPIYGQNFKYSDVFQIEDNNEISSKEDFNTQNKQFEVIKLLLSDERFEYNKYKYNNGSGFTSKKLKINANYSKTPYICFDKQYDENIGLFNNI